METQVLAQKSSSELATQKLRQQTPALPPLSALRPSPPSSFALDHLTDAELLSSTRSMVGRSNVVFAALLAHLAEVETRRLYRERACSSLYTYCVYELRMSEDAAQRRVQAARLVRKFPELLDVVAAGELHLTGLLLLGPHLTHENLAQVLLLAKHRSKREILALVRRLDPQPNAPARIEPLGAAVVTAVCGGPWEKWVGSLVPVNHLKPGDRPRDWIPSDAEESSGSVHADECSGHADGGHDEFGEFDPANFGVAEVESDGERIGRGDHGAGVNADERSGHGGGVNADERSGHGGGVNADERSGHGGGEDDGERGFAARGDGESAASSEATEPAHTKLAQDLLTAPQRYKVQFTASEEHIQLLREARELLGTAVKGRAIEEVHLRAMRALVRELKKRKCAMLDRPRAATKTKRPRHSATEDGGACCDDAANPLQRGSKRDDACKRAVDDGDTLQRGSKRDDACKRAAGDRDTRQRGSNQGRAADDGDTRQRGSKEHPTGEDLSSGEEPESSRNIPASVRRAVWERDGGRCTYVDCRGQRCRERSGLEFHHEVAFAKRGRHIVENVWLRCKAHNDLAAEQDFGEAHMARVKGDVPP
ncbi:MAG: hypothetical protein R3B13_16395 [Polyangiaceae bacterium]